MLRRGFSPLKLFATMFVLFCGGPFSLEEIVPLAGPGLFALVLIVMAVIWALPYALITAELISELPVQGGTYQWFRAGLGPFWSFIFTYLEWLAWAVDAVIYPALFAKYLMQPFVDDPSLALLAPIWLGMIWGCAWLNVRGVKEVGFLSMILTVMILVPVIAMIALSVPQMSLSAFSPLWPEDQKPWIALNYAIVWSVWSYSGYSGLATASEEIVEPERTYPKMLAIFLPISVAVYVLSLWAGLTAAPDWQNWGEAHLTVAAFVLGGPVLATLIVVAALVAQLGLYNSEQLVLGRYVYAVARDRMLPPFLGRLHPRHQTPYVALILHAILFSVLVFVFDFVELLLLGALVSVPVYLLTFLSPLILRWKYPNLRGPFRIPGGWPVIIPTAVVPCLIAIYLVATAKPSGLITTGMLFSAAPVIYWAVRAYNRRHGVDMHAFESVELTQALEQGRARPKSAPR
ncbi:MAG: APC family permease [Myxococcota bacterium]